MPRRLRAREILKQREEEVAAYATEDNQSERGRLFEVLADMGDDDAALTEIEDLEDWEHAKQIIEKKLTKEFNNQGQNASEKKESSPL